MKQLRTEWTKLRSIENNGGMYGYFIIKKECK